MTTADTEDVWAQLVQRLAGLHRLLDRIETLWSRRRQLVDSTVPRAEPELRRHPVLVLLGAVLFWLILFVITNGYPRTPAMAVVVLASTPIFAVVVVVFYNHLLKQENRRRRAFNARLPGRFERDTVRLGTIDSQLTAAVLQYEDLYKGWIPDRFVDSDTVGQLVQIVMSRRATDVISAIDCFLTDQCQQERVDPQQAKLIEQRRASQNATVHSVITTVSKAVAEGRIEGRELAVSDLLAAQMSADQTVSEVVNAKVTLSLDELRSRSSHDRGPARLPSCSRLTALGVAPASSPPSVDERHQTRRTRR